ncbi:MAG: LysR family transcriptional regulator [Treponema sp.]|jgi:DNA-binding transcriptional LysR family regulator|nr:LysR family transcriptional regulator [Treponema sp.]
MELTQLAQFKAIAEYESMSRAAEKICISQPSLSASLRKLEEELGVRLFERRKGKIMLNDAGKMALQQVNAIFEHAEKMKAEMEQYKRKENTISIAFCDPGPLRFCIPKFSMEFPDAEIHYNRFEENGKEIELLLDGINDIVCTSRTVEHDDVTCVHFIKDCLFLSVPASHPLAKEKTVSLKKIKSLSIMQPNPGGSFLAKQKQFWKSLRPNIKMALYDDPAVFIQILRNTNGITVSTTIVRHYRDDGQGRVLVPLENPEMSIDYYFCYLAKNRNRLSAFLLWLEQ